MSLFINTPVVGSNGRFGTSQPFDIAVDPLLEYTVLEVRTISALIDDGKDVFKSVYEVVGLPIDVYESDVLNSINIATLISPSNDYVYVPVNRFTSVPKVLGPVYVEKAVVVNLGMLPLEFDIGPLMDSFKGTVSSIFGKVPTTKVIETSSRTLVDIADDKLFRDKAFNATMDYGSLEVRYKKALDTIARQNDIISKYKEYVKIKENE